MTVPQMRAAVHDAYEGKAWRNKVNNMSDIQVQAVYLSMSERGFFNQKIEKKPIDIQNKPTETKGFEPFIGKQLSMF